MCHIYLMQYKMLSSHRHVLCFIFIINFRIKWKLKIKLIINVFKKKKFHKLLLL